MTDHIRDSIDQLFPPEPPDDPRPEPPPPPDDALPACPNCGALGRSLNITTDGKWRLGLCDECDFALGIKEWNRLARAVALLRAVVRIDASSMMDVEVMRDGDEWKLRDRIGSHVTLSDALIALAAQLEARDD